MTKIMQDFIVYPKKGKPFTISIDTYKCEGGHFLLYDQLHQVSNDGFLAFDHIAAILPAHPYKSFKCFHERRDRLPYIS